MNERKLIQNCKKTSMLFFVFSLVGSAIFFSLCRPSFAQSLSTGIAFYVAIPGNTVQPGSIVSLSAHTYHLSDVAYDPTAFGITVKDPVVYIDNPKDLSPATYAVVHDGKAYVRVSTINGKIAKGDLLTTSKIPGVAEKATQDGYVIGTALEPYDSSNTQKDALIQANITFSFFTNPTNRTQNLITSLQQAVESPYLTPATLIRYIVATIIVVLTLILGIGHFGRIATTGIEALGRNPLASKVIFLGSVLNIAIMIAVVVSGIAVAYFVLVL